MKKNQKELKRFFSKRKVEVVLRMLRGESLDELSRELVVPASRLSEWRDEFLRAGEASMKTREPSATPTVLSLRSGGICLRRRRRRD